MKKTLIFFLISSLSSLAATSGYIETKQEISNKLHNGFNNEKTNLDTKIKGEIRVIDANLKAGVEIKAKGAVNNGTNYQLQENDSKIWAEYQLPDIQEVGSKIRVESNLKLEMKVQAEVFTTSEEVEYFAKAWYEGTKLFFTPKKAQGEIGFTHKGIEGLDFLGAKVSGGLTSLDKMNGEKENYEIIFEAYGKYIGVKDFKLKFSGKAVYKQEKNGMGNSDKYEAQIKVTPEYSKNNISFIAEDTEVLYKISEKKVKLVFKPEVKYTGIKDTTLGVKIDSYYEYKHNDNKHNYTVKPILFYEYKYMATDNFSIIPKGEVNLEINNKVTSGEVPTTLTPSLKLEYKPISELKFELGAGFPFTFKFKNSISTNSDIEVRANGQFQVKYEW